MCTGTSGKSIVFEGLLICRVLRGCPSVVVRGWLLGLNRPGDVAGLPLLLLAAGAVSLVMLPAAHAISRVHERAPISFALQLTKTRARSSRQCGGSAQNLAEEDPSTLVQWLFHSHLPIRERIAAAQTFKV